MRWLRWVLGLLLGATLGWLLLGRVRSRPTRPAAFAGAPSPLASSTSGWDPRAQDEDALVTDDAEAPETHETDAEAPEPSPDPVRESVVSGHPPGLSSADDGTGSAAPTAQRRDPEATGTDAREGTAIKGNRSSMLYHTPDSPYYGRTKAEEWFDTEEQARAAGYTRWGTKR